MQYPGLSPVARPGFHQVPFHEWHLGSQLEKHSMNKVLRITLRGELQVFTDSDLDACIREANRLNTERGYRNGVCVVEMEDGQRMTAADCKAAA